MSAYNRYNHSMLPEERGGVSIMITALVPPGQLTYLPSLASIRQQDYH